MIICILISPNDMHNGPLSFVFQLVCSMGLGKCTQEKDNSSRISIFKIT